MGRHRVGRRPWGPEQERLHPRDDRGRFAKKGGRSWAAKMLKLASQGVFDQGEQLGGSRPEFRAAEAFRVHDNRHPGAFGGVGRVPGGVIDIGQTRRTIEAAQPGNSMMQAGKDIARSGYSNKAVRVGSNFRRVVGQGFDPQGDFLEVQMDLGQTRRIHYGPDQKFEVRIAKTELAEPLRGIQQRHMNALQAASRKPAPFRKPTMRDERRRQIQDRIAGLEADRAAEVKKLQSDARKIYPGKYGYSAADRKDYVKQGLARGVDYDLNYQRKLLSELETDQDPFMDLPGLGMSTFTGTLDEAHPLSVYGDMLAIETEDQATLRHLTDLEQLPAALHQIVAAYMHSRRGKTYSGNTPGIYVGAKSVDDLDSMQHLKKSKPGGSWNSFPGGNPGWGAVDGVYSGDGTLVVGMTEMSKSRGEHGQPALHEFGHALDHAVGKHLALNNFNGSGYSDWASNQTDWRDIHRAVVAQSPFLHPHFHDNHQATARGASELWAEAFAEWARARASARRRGGGANPDLVNSRGIAKMKSEFGIDEVTAKSVHDYFLDLAKRLGVAL